MCARSHRPPSSLKRWSRWCWPRLCWRRPVAIRSPKWPGTSPSTWPPSRRPCDEPPRLILIGPPGAGKTSVGRLLAEFWQVTYRDTDADIESAEARPIADIFLDEGEEYFRRQEHAAVLRALSGHDGVLALGGGAVMDPATQEELRGHDVLFLDVGVADATKRVGLARSRPLLVDSPRRQWQQLMAHRRPVYERLAAHTVPTDGLTPLQVRDAVLTLLEEG